MKFLVMILLFIAQSAWAGYLSKCGFSTYVDEQFYGMIHYVQVPNGNCKLVSGSLDRISGKSCSQTAVKIESQCYQVTTTRITTEGQYVGKTYNCWGCLK